jgi:hypothetical protein
MDISGFTEDTNFPELLEEACLTAEAAVKLKGAKWVVVDSASAINAALVAYYSKRREGYKIWSAVKEGHEKLFNRISSLGCGSIFVFHPRAVTSDDADKKRAESVQGAPPIEIDISGQAKGMYRRNLSTIMLVQRDISAKTPTHWIYPRGKFGFEGKCRFHNLEDKEPANLRQLLKKIQTKA